MQEQRDREEQEEWRLRELDGREQRQREELERQEQKEALRVQEERGKKKRRKEKRQSKEREGKGMQTQRQEGRPQLTPDELEEYEQRKLESEERRKQDEQEAQRWEPERAEAERQRREEEEWDRHERIKREQEIEAMKRAREAMDAEERFRRERDAKRREKEERNERRRQEEEERRREEESRGAQHAGYRRMDEEIRRKRQDSGGRIESAWTSFNAGTSSFPSSSRSPPPTRNFTTPFPGERPAPAWTSWGATPSPTPGSAWSTNMAGNTSTAGFPPRPSTTVPNKPRSGSTGSAVPDPLEWQRKQEEFTRQQQEKFKQEQLKQEQARAQRAAWGGRPTKDDLVKLFEENERTWISLSSRTSLRWSDFPWPMLKRPSNPEEITTMAIQSYVLSQYYPDKSRSEKDRVKDCIKRWHPDRFETKLLNKVVEEEKEKVKEGAACVVSSLNELRRNVFREEQTGTSSSSAVVSDVRRNLVDNPVFEQNQSISTLRAEVLRVCSSKSLYREMLSSGELEAQKWLDTLQTVSVLMLAQFVHVRLISGFSFCDV